jgi:radical SAM superfamily enzyme YgiQ (UPF0313 family)
LACLGGALQEAHIPYHIIDCLAEKIGWQSLKKKIEDINPNIVCVGENHALFSDESEKCFALAKACNPNIVTIAGGGHFAHLHENYLSKNYGIDYIVFGEGEITLVKLIQSLLEGKSTENIQGIAYRRENKIVRTKPRPLIDDLDSLPFPAFDSLPMQKYGANRYLFNPGGATLEHSRGCASDCHFCVWWTQMAKREESAAGDITLRPTWRTKSPERTLSEMEYLYNTHHKRFFVFVDGSWNISAEFNKRFSELIIKKNLSVEWFAFVRVDCLLRDEKTGILELMVKAGLRHVCIGIETTDDNKLKKMNKSFYNLNDTTRIYKIFREKYPQVFIQGTFIVGDQEETRESLWQRLELAKKLQLDHPAFHPLTPVPGTKLYQEAVSAGWLETTTWSDYDWATPVMSSKYLSRTEIAYEIYRMTRKLITPLWLIKGLLSPYQHKRNMYVWWLMVTLRIIFGDIRRTIGFLNPKHYQTLYEPTWYQK